MARLLEGKVALVTGASRGIGRAVSLRLAEHGARLVLTARGDLSSTVLAVRELGSEAYPVRADLTRRQDLEALAQETPSAFGRLDILVNNAGGGGSGDMLHATPDDIDYAIDLNLRAVILLTRMLIAEIAKNAGAVVNISSIAGRMGIAGMAAYSAAKHGLTGFSESLFEVARDSGVKVSVICPGYVDTDIGHSKKLAPAKMIAPEDVADAVVYILTSGPRVCPTEIVLRPQKNPTR
jgi:NAD(P)-dependent dehydrogenase (short-subunit alcohol dehydrogenase family)